MKRTWDERNIVYTVYILVHRQPYVCHSSTQWKSAIQWSNAWLVVHYYGTIPAKKYCQYRIYSASWPTSCWNVSQSVLLELSDGFEHAIISSISTEWLLKLKISMTFGGMSHLDKSLLCIHICRLSTGYRENAYRDESHWYKATVSEFLLVSKRIIVIVRIDEHSGPILRIHIVNLDWSYRPP